MLCAFSECWMLKNVTWGIWINCGKHYLVTMSINEQRHVKSYERTEIGIQLCWVHCWASTWSKRISLLQWWLDRHNRKQSLMVEDKPSMITSDWHTKLWNWCGGWFPQLLWAWAGFLLKYEWDITEVEEEEVGSHHKEASLQTFLQDFFA